MCMVGLCLVLFCITQMSHERHGIPNHWQLGCLIKSLLKPTAKKIGPSHKSHNASDTSPTIHRFITEMYTYVHIVFLQNGALWDVGLVRCGICEIVLYTSTTLLALCNGDPPMTSGFPSQMTSNTENASMSSGHHGFIKINCRFQWYINHIPRGYFTGIGSTTWLLQCLKETIKDTNEMDRYQTTTKHNETRTVCIKILVFTYFVSKWRELFDYRICTSKIYPFCTLSIYKEAYWNIQSAKCVKLSYVHQPHNNASLCAGDIRELFSERWSMIIDRGHVACCSHYRPSPAVCLVVCVW